GGHYENRVTSNLVAGYLDFPPYSSILETGCQIAGELGLKILVFNARPPLSMIAKLACITKIWVGNGCDVALPEICPTVYQILQQAQQKL
ncbi:hypothetical protein E2320_021188, partial [Naja naja]